MRTKIEVNYSLLGHHGSKAMHIMVGSNTTSADVIQKVLDKNRKRDPPIKYQLWAVARDTSSAMKDKPLRDDDCPGEIMASQTGATGKTGLHFHLRLRSSSLLRVYHSLDDGSQSFQSLIVTPGMSMWDVVQLAVSRAYASEDPRQYQLLQKTSSGELIVGEEEYPFLLQSKSTNFELRRKTARKQLQFETTPTATPTSQQTGQLLTPDSGRPESAVATINSDDKIFDYSSIVSAVEMNRGKLQLHAQLIDALRQFATKSAASPLDGSRTGGTKTRENVLEQALVEQNQILDIMQELVATLETENKFSRDKINSQAMVIHNLSKAEVIIPTATATATSTTTGIPEKKVKDSAMVRSEKVGTLKAKAAARSEDDDRVSSTLLSATRTKLEAERIRVIELQEELSSRRDEINKLRNAFSEKRSVIISKESEVLHLRHEMESLKKLGGQQQDAVMRLRTALMDKEIQLTSLTRALSKEKKITEQIRRRQLHQNPPPALPKVADSNATQSNTPHMFEQVVGREVHALELTRVSSDCELGFSYAKMELPVSSKVPCLIVKAVRESGAAYGVLKPGDEILEVCGHSCRSTDQNRALECLEQTVGVLKLVVARDQEDSNDQELGVRYHSTPLKAIHKEDTTLWTTALSEISSLSEPSTAEFITVLEPSNSTSPENKLQSTSEKKVARSDSQMEDSGDSFDEREMNAEVAELQDQLDESEQLRFELTEEMEGTKAELDNIQMEFDLTKAENFELQQQVSTHEQEMGEIRLHIQELQAALVKLEDQITDDHEKIGTLENSNRLVSQELLEAQGKFSATKKECSDAQTGLEKLRDSAHEKEKLHSQIEEELATFRDVNDRLKSDNLKKDQQIGSLKSQFETMKVEHEGSLSEVHEQAKKLKLELQSVNETSIKTALTAHEEHEQLRVQLNSAKTILMEAEMKESTLKVEMRYLKQAADLANKQLEEKEEHLKKISEELSSYKHRAESKTLEMEALALGLRTAQGKLGAKVEMISRLQKDVDGLRRTNTKLQSERSQLERARRELESKLKVTVSEQTHLEEKLASSNNEKDDLFQQLEESIAETTSLQYEIDQLNCKLEEAESVKKRGIELESKVKELTVASKSMEEESYKKVEVLKAERSIAVDELSRVRTDIAAAMETSQSSTGRLEELQKELTTQRTALLTSESERVSLAHNCDSLRKKEVEHLREIESLKSDNGSLLETIDQLKLAQSGTQKEMDVLQKKSDGLNQQFARLKEDLKSSEANSEQMRKELQEHKAKVELSNKTIEEQKLEMQDLQNRLSKLSTDLDEKCQEAEDFKSNFEEVSNQLAVERKRESESRSACAALEANLTQLRAAKKQSDDMVASLEFMQEQNQAKLEELAESLRTKDEGLKKLGEKASEDQEQLKRSRTQSLSLTDSMASMKQKLKDAERITETEIASLKEKLSTSELELQSVKSELENRKETNSKQSVAILQWKKSLEHANEERYKLQKSVDDSSRQKQQVEARNTELETQLVNAHTEKEHLQSSNNTLSSETARIRQQLKQSGREMDNMSAKLLALEMNLGVAHKSLDESVQLQTELSHKVGSLESQFGDTSTELEQSVSNVEKATLELHVRDEHISKLKASLDLRQKECSELQQSLLTVQSSAAAFEKWSQALAVEKKDLTATIEQLKDCQDGLKTSLLELEKEKERAVDKWKTIAEDLKTQVEQLESKEKDQFEEIRRLEQTSKESQSNVEQLQAAQEALKQSINTLGDEKEIEVMRLGERAMELESQLSTSQKELSKAHTTEEDLREDVVKLDEQVRNRSDQCKQLKDENVSLKREVDMCRETEQKLTDLHSKLTALEEGLRTKNVKLEELEENSQKMESELTQTQKENETLLTEITQLASLKLSLAEKSAEIDRLNRELSSRAKTHSELTSERDQLLTMLRKLEVEKHTEVVQQPTPKLARGADKDPAKLVELLKDKEEEAFRLREYVGKLLSSVVEKAPFVLENMH